MQSHRSGTRLAGGSRGDGGLECQAESCLDPEELLATQQLEVWLQAWTRTPDCPRSQLTVSSARIAEEAKDHELEMRASALEESASPSPRLRHRGLPGTQVRKNWLLVIPGLFGKSREFFSSSSQRAEAQSLTELDRVAQEAVLSKLADSTHRSYGSGKKQWEIFMSGTGVSSFPSGETREEKTMSNGSFAS